MKKVVNMLLFLLKMIFGLFIYKNIHMHKEVIKIKYSKFIKIINNYFTNCKIFPLKNNKLSYGVYIIEEDFENFYSILVLNKKRMFIPILQIYILINYKNGTRKIIPTTDLLIREIKKIRNEE